MSGKYSYYCSNFKFGMRIYVYEYNRNILEICLKYTDDSPLLRLILLG